MKILYIIIVLALIVGVLAAGGPGDEAAKDRAEAKAIEERSAIESAQGWARIESESSAAQANAYAVRQQTDAMATAIAMNAQNNQVAMSAMATQAAYITGQYSAVQPAPATGGLGLFDVALALAVFVTLGVTVFSVALTLWMSRRQATERVIYIHERPPLLAETLEPGQLLLRPLPPGKSRARLVSGRDRE